MTVTKRTATAGDVQMDYAVFGNGSKTMVILPGLCLESILLSAETVANAYRSFTDEYTVYLFDRPRSVREGYTLVELGHDTAAAILSLGITDAYFFGASQGGMMIQVIAALCPALVKKAVLGSTAARSVPSFSEIVGRWIGFAQKEDVVSLNREFFKYVYSEDFQAKYKNAFSVLENHGSPEDCRRFVKIAGTLLDFDLSPMAESIKCPVLVIGAEGDAVTPPAEAQRLASLLHCECFLYPGYSHAVYDEAPDYLDRIKAFFQ